MEGTLTGVGVGPGDPELLTLKAVRIIKECQVVAVPETGGENLALDIARPYLEGREVLRLSMPMTADGRELEKIYRDAARTLCGYLEQGNNVAFLTLGDPSVYSTFSYLKQEVSAYGFDVQSVPGVTSFCAAAAALDISLCTGDTPLHLIPATRPDVEQLLPLPGTKVLMKAGKRLPALLPVLEQAGLLDKTALAERCGLEGERLLPTLTGETPAGSYFTTLMIKE